MSVIIWFWYGSLHPVACNSGVGKGLGLMWFISSGVRWWCWGRCWHIVVEVEGMLKFYIWWLFVLFRVGLFHLMNLWWINIVKWHGQPHSATATTNDPCCHVIITNKIFRYIFNPFTMTTMVVAERKERPGQHGAKGMFFSSLFSYILLIILPTSNHQLFTATTTHLHQHLTPLLRGLFFLLQQC